MLNSPDFETQEQKIVRDQWQIWRDKLYEGVDTKDEDFNPLDYELDFTVDRSAESSLVTSERVVVFELLGPLEEWRENEPALTSNKAEINPEEEWIEIHVTPKNPYNPKLGFHSHGKTKDYYTEELRIYLSSNGHAFEETVWTDIKVFDHHTSLPSYSYLKREPMPEEIQTRLTEEPDPDDTKPTVNAFVEHLKPLEGGNLERLDSLMRKIQTGQAVIK